MKCLFKYQWVKLPRNQLPSGKGIMGAWARLASRAAFRNGHATAAIVFGFLMERCNARFSVKQKINRTLDNLLKLYDVGAEEREEVIAQVLDLDLNDCAEKIMAWVLEKERVKSADYLQNGG